jgi:hypothetical protein
MPAMLLQCVLGLTVCELDTLGRLGGAPSYAAHGAINMHMALWLLLDRCTLHDKFTLHRGFIRISVCTQQMWLRRCTAS